VIGRCGRLFLTAARRIEVPPPDRGHPGGRGGSYENRTLAAIQRGPSWACGPVLVGPEAEVLGADRDVPKRRRADRGFPSAVIRMMRDADFGGFCVATPAGKGNFWAAGRVAPLTAKRPVRLG